MYVYNGSTIHAGYGGNGSWNNIFPGPNITPNAWTHIAFVYDGGNMMIYIDGALGFTQASANVVQPLYGITQIGGYDGVSQFFMGDIRDVRIWNVARTQMEISDNMGSVLTGLEPGLIAYYKLDDDPNSLEILDSGPNMFNGHRVGVDLCDTSPIPNTKDLANNLISYWNFEEHTLDRVGNNNGTVVGNGSSYTPGPFGSAIDLDGGDTYVDVGNDASLNMTGKSITVSAWFRVDAFTDSWQALISKGEGQNFRLHRLGGSDRISYNGGSPEIHHPKNINDGQFHHVVAITENGVRKYIYLDGILVMAGTYNADIVDSDLSLLIGNNPDILSRDWNGAIDDVAIWDRVLNDCEIETLYSSGMSLRELLMIPVIPTLSTWGIITLLLIMLIIGLISVRQRRKLYI